MVQVLLPILGISAVFLTGCSQEKPSVDRLWNSIFPPEEPKTFHSKYGQGSVDRNAKGRLDVGDEIKFLPKEAFHLGNYFVGDQNGDGLLGPGDLIFRKNAANRYYSVLDPNSAEIDEFLQSLGHCPERPLRLDEGVQAYLQVKEVPNLKLTTFVGEQAVSLLIEDYEKARRYARANHLDLFGSAHLDIIQQGLQRDYLDYQCPTFNSFKAYLRRGCAPRLDEELENCRTIADGLKTYAGIDKSSDITWMEKRVPYLKARQAELKVLDRCGSMFDW